MVTDAKMNAESYANKGDATDWKTIDRDAYPDHREFARDAAALQVAIATRCEREGFPTVDIRYEEGREVRRGAKVWNIEGFRCSHTPPGQGTQKELIARALNGIPQSYLEVE